MDLHSSVRENEYHEENKIKYKLYFLQNFSFIVFLLSSYLYLSIESLLNYLRIEKFIQL